MKNHIYDFFRIYTPNVHLRGISSICRLQQSKKYEEALAIVNFKGKLTKYIAKQTIVDNYPDRVLGLIRSNNALREVIKKKYFG